MVGHSIVSPLACLPLPYMLLNSGMTGRKSSLHPQDTGRKHSKISDCEWSALINQGLMVVL